MDGNGGGAVNYEPNSFGGPVDNHAYNQPPFDIRGMGNHYQQDKDYYTQPGDLYRLVPEDEKKRIHTNVAAAMEGVPVNIKVRWQLAFTKQTNVVVKVLPRRQAWI